MTDRHEAKSPGIDQEQVSTREKIVGATTPLEQLKTLDRAVGKFPSYLQVPINYDEVETVLREIEQEDFGDEHLLSLFVMHRSSQMTEAFNWRLLQRYYPSYPTRQDSEQQPGISLSSHEFWSQTSWDEPFRYSPGLYIVELEFYQAAGKSIDQLRSEYQRPAGAEALSAIALQRGHFAGFGLGEVAIGGLYKDMGQSTRIAPNLKIDNHTGHTVDAVWTDAELKRGVVPVITAACQLQEFQW